MVKFLKEAAQVKPSKKQLDWFHMHSSISVRIHLQTENGDREMSRNPFSIPPD